jgi:hypothetical protein
MDHEPSYRYPIVTFGGLLDHEPCVTMEQAPRPSGRSLNDLGVNSTMAKGVSPAQGNQDVAKLSPVQRLKVMLATEADIDGGNGSDFMEQSIEEMLLADTFDEVMELAASDAGLNNGKSMINKPIQVTAFAVTRSDAKFEASSPLGFYVRVSAAYKKDGKEIQFATGAPKIVVPLWRARQENLLPLDCVVREREVGAGTMLYLELDNTRFSVDGESV